MNIIRILIIFFIVKPNCLFGQNYFGLLKDKKTGNPIEYVKQ